MTCNIDNTDRINRAVLGLILILAGIFDISRTFLILFGVILIIQGLIGWCSIPILLKKIIKT